MIKVYTQPGCTACHHAIAYLTSRGWEFEEINIRQTPGAIDELRRLAVTATPALVIGEKLVIGFNREEIDKAVAALG